jgi:hypothetical protein
MMYSNRQSVIIVVMSSPRRSSRPKAAVRGPTTEAPPATSVPIGAASMTAHFARSAILAAATKVFSQRGIAPTRVEDILVAANIARRTFYTSRRRKKCRRVCTRSGPADHRRSIGPRPPASVAVRRIRAGIDIYGPIAGVSRARELPSSRMQPICRSLAPQALRAQVVRLGLTTRHALDGHMDRLCSLRPLSAPGISIELAASDTPSEDVDRARLAIHAIVDHTLGLPKPIALPKRASS